VIAYTLRARKLKGVVVVAEGPGDAPLFTRWDHEHDAPATYCIEGGQLRTLIGNQYAPMGGNPRIERCALPDWARKEEAKV